MIKWVDNNTPLSERFDDTYYSTSDGRAETGHVYIRGNNLHERWLQMQDCTIGELGFGTGLNFLETTRQWQALKPTGAKLHFISFEQYPLSRKQMLQALMPWGELKDSAITLTNYWRFDADLLEMNFDEDVSLTVYFGDANDLLPNLDTQFDAWYLDGFSPAKNPQLWNEDLMKSVYNKTKPAGTFATYSVAGYVRRNLQQAGFSINRQKGFGSKREMLMGIRN